MQRKSVMGADSPHTPVLTQGHLFAAEEVEHLSTVEEQGSVPGLGELEHELAAEEQ